MRPALPACLVLGSLMVAGAAHAAPDFDTPGYCRATVTQGDEPFKKAKYDYCIQTEHHARGMLGHWGYLGPKTMQDCTEEARSVGPAARGQGSYGILVTCLKGQAALRREREGGRE